MKTDTVNALPLEALWGKADFDVAPEPHPVLLHMLDVAAVAFELVDGHRLPSSLCEDLLAPMGLHDLAFAIALHDLGKITPGFQAKVPRLKDRLIALGADFPHAAEINHALSTAALCHQLLVAHGVDRECARLVTAAVAGHHGSFHPLRPRTDRVRHGGPPWDDARARAFSVLSETLGATPETWTKRPSEAWLMAVAGLTVLADWIGSDTRFFPYHPGAAASTAYFEAARIRARDALDALGFIAMPSVGAPSFVDLFGFPPRPMQDVVATAVDAMPQPGLVVIESPTGGGKTEAALYAAESMMARFGLGGAYIALPTQATSNQMFGRVRDYLARSLERRGIERVNLQLLHGSRDLVSTYDELKRESFRARAVDGTSRSDGAVVAESWFAGKKRGLLAPFAVGTVDQALMSALQSRHYFLRLLGLARKVVIIDEVHAYDAFMSRILDRLLRWLKTLGSGVILLSATLPAPRKAELFTVWLGDGTAPTPQWPRYPRVMTSADRLVVRAIPRDDASRREVALVSVRPPSDTTDGPGEVARRLLIALPDGCAAWIHNTVGEAQAAYDALIANGLSADECILFHARFPLEDRLALEARVLSALDKEASRPKRLVVVSTQVIEQSLDIDVDLMVTSLAPVDLLVQRAGRLHRHALRDPSRPTSLSTPTLWIVGRREGAEPADFGPSGYVYEPHILMRTELALEGRPAWTLPDEADALLELVYPPENQLDTVPAGLDETRSTAWRTTAKDLADALQVARSKGGEHLVPPSIEDEDESFLDAQRGPDLYDPEEAPDKHPAVLARTRDMEPTVTLICLTHGAGPLDLDAEPDRDLTRALLNRGISLQHRAVVRTARSIDPPRGWRRSAALRHARAVFFGPDHRADFGGVSLTLDPVRGLSFESTATKEAD